MKRSRTLLPLLGAAALAALLLPMARPAAAAPAPQTAPAAAPLLLDPLPGAALTCPFGPRINPISKRPDFHDALDLAAAVGTPVRAAAAGTVSAVTLDRAAPRGMTVAIDHGNGLSTFYAFLDPVAVRPGQAVAAGEAIGAVGAVGVSTGPHLHFQALQAGQAVDPRPLVDWRK
jgi:murein DD-endopeptidase MepM/ murein hydrolase activator NlpD